MLASIAKLFSSGEADDAKTASLSTRQHLHHACSTNEVSVLYLFAHGNLERHAFVAQAAALLGGGPDVDQDALAALFNEARDPVIGSLSYAQLKAALQHSPPPATAPQPLQRPETGAGLGTAVPLVPPAAVPRGADQQPH